jgi:hypothetical protein
MNRSLAYACVLLALPTAHAADDWHFQAVVYGYLPSISGSTTFSPVGGGDAGINTDDILEHLKLAFMAAFDASTATTGVLADVIYADLGNTRTRDIAIGGRSTNTTATLDLNLKGWLWTLAATYTLSDTPQHRLQLLAGTRGFDLAQDLGWQLSASGGRASTSLTNWDAIVGIRGRLLFGAQRNWFAPYYLDLGTGESEFTGQALIGLGYSFHWGDVLAAWRYTDYDMKSGTATQSLSLDGPAIGVAFRW